MDRAQWTNDLAGKILRMKDDGTVPPDNPFVGKAGYKPYIYSIGHRVPLGLAFNPYTNELWEHENGPNGGDELNIIRAGHNYGWPIVSYGRDYNGPRFTPTLPGMDDPVVYWVPSIAPSGLTFYTGDKFPGWTRNVFVGGMREGEIARSEMGGDASRAAAAGSAPTGPRHPSGPGRPAVSHHRRRRGGAAQNRARQVVSAFRRT